MIYADANVIIRLLEGLPALQSRSKSVNQRDRASINADRCLSSTVTKGHKRQFSHKRPLDRRRDPAKPGTLCLTRQDRSLQFSRLMGRANVARRARYPDANCRRGSLAKGGGLVSSGKQVRLH